MVNIQSERVTPGRSERGESGYRIDLTLTPAETPHAILASSLFVRGSDWRPVSQRLTVRAADHEEHFEIEEIGYDVVPFEQLTSSVFAPEPALSAGTPTIPPPAISPAPARTADLAQLFSLEVRVRYALHRIHACTGEPIQVDTSPEGVRVRGMLDTEARKREVLQAMASLKEASLQVRLRDPGQASAADLSLADSIPAAPDSSANEGSGSALPIEALISRDANGVAPDALVKLSNEAIQSGRALLMDAWAIRRLLDRYPDLPSTESADNRWLLEVMLRDHMVAFERNRSRLAEIVSLIEPSLVISGVSAVIAGTPQQDARVLVDTANQANSMVLLLFARSQSGAGAETLQTLASRLAEMEELSSRLRAVVGG